MAKLAIPLACVFCQYLHAPQTGTVGKLCQLKGRRTRLSPLEEFIMCHTILQYVLNDCRQKHNISLLSEIATTKTIRSVFLLFNRLAYLNPSTLSQSQLYTLSESDSPDVNYLLLYVFQLATANSSNTFSNVSTNSAIFVAFNRQSLIYSLSVSM